MQIAKLKNQKYQINNHKNIKKITDYEVIFEEILNQKNMKWGNRLYTVSIPEDPGIYRYAIYDARFKSDVGSMSYYFFIEIE